MNPRLQRALMLLNQSRYDQAEDELRQALGQDPNDAVSHAALALCLVERKQYAEASQEAAAAIHLDPENPFGFQAQAMVFRQRNDFRQAEQAVRQAIDLAPEDADYFALLAQIMIDQRRWPDALAAAEQGLEFDPDNSDCANLRVVALRQTRQKDQAQEAIAETLSRDPENALSHTNMGWSLLGQGDHRQAMEHFREALRLEPNLEWARLGIIESLKARRWLYRPVLKYLLWTATLSGRAQWGLVVGGWIGYQVLRNVARNNEDVAPYVLPFIALYILWAVSTWIAIPLFNLALLLDPLGRVALSREEKRTGTWTGLCLLGAVGCIVGLFLLPSVAWIVAALALFFLIPPLSRIYSCEEGWPRWAMIGITSGLALVGASAVTGFAVSDAADAETAERATQFASNCLTIFVFGSIASQFAANALAGVRPRR